MNKHSRVCANIDLSAIMHNMEAMHQNIDPNTKIMAVIKADGYGHGAVPIAKEIEHLDYVYGYAFCSGYRNEPYRVSGDRRSRR